LHKIGGWIPSSCDDLLQIVPLSWDLGQDAWGVKFIEVCANVHLLDLSKCYFPCTQRNPDELCYCEQSCSLHQLTMPHSRYGASLGGSLCDTSKT
jgi:hypothetical protein